MEPSSSGCPRRRCHFHCHTRSLPCGLALASPPKNKVPRLHLVPLRRLMLRPSGRESALSLVGPCVSCLRSPGLVEVRRITHRSSQEPRLQLRTEAAIARPPGHGCLPPPWTPVDALPRTGAAGHDAGKSPNQASGKTVLGRIPRRCMAQHGMPGAVLPRPPMSWSTQPWSHPPTSWVASVEPPVRCCYSVLQLRALGCCPPVLPSATSMRARRPSPHACACIHT